MGGRCSKPTMGRNLIWTTSSTSAGFERKLNVLYILCYLFRFHFLFTPVPNGAAICLAHRLDSTRTALCLKPAAQWGIQGWHWHWYETFARRRFRSTGRCQIRRGIPVGMRMVVGPPANTNYASSWHEIFHGWTNEVKVLSHYAGLKPGSVTCVEAVCVFHVVQSMIGQNLAFRLLAPFRGCLRASKLWLDLAKVAVPNVARNLLRNVCTRFPSHRGITRVLASTPPGTRTGERKKESFDSSWYPQFRTSSKDLGSKTVGHLCS